jgi:hypothetical protein
MVNSFTMMRAGFAVAQADPIHRKRHRSHEIAHFSAAISGICDARWNPLKRKASSIVEPRQGL